MKVLVTGSSGYIGRVLCRHLYERHVEVTGYDGRLFTDDDWFAEPKPWLEYAHDIRDITIEFLEGFDAIIHLAGISNDPVGELNPDLTFSINRDASDELARMAKRAGCRTFIFSSSCSVYGQSGEALVDEKTPVNPVTAYAASKAEAEQRLVHLADETFQVVILRNATVFGSSPALRTDLVVNNLVVSGVYSGVVRLNSDGSAWRPQIHVEDLAHIMYSILKTPSALTNASPYNVGFTASNYTVSQIAEVVAQSIDNCRIDRPHTNARDRRSYRVSFKKLHDALHIEQNWSLERGVADLRDRLVGRMLANDGFAPQVLGQRISSLVRSIEQKKISDNLRRIW